MKKATHRKKYHIISLHAVPKVVKFIESKSRMVIALGWGRSTCSCLMGTEVQFCKKKRVLEIVVMVAQQYECT